MKRSEFILKVKRRLGYPMVKVELCDNQIIDHLDYAIDYFIEWAVGNATDIIYFTIPLKGGQKFYDLPKGVIEIMEYDEDSMSIGGINTLFTVENYFFNQGYYDPMLQYPYSMTGYHLVLDWMETMERYNPDKYSWRYHKSANKLELSPTPEYNKDNISVDRIDPTTNTVKTYTLDSPGYVLIKANVVEGTTLPYIIRDWDDVMREIIPSSELRTISSDEANNDYFALTYRAFKGNLTIYKNGIEYTKWQWHDDAKRIIRWVYPNEINEGDKYLLKYSRVDIRDSGENYSTEKNHSLITQTYDITPLDIAAKSFLLQSKTIDPEGVEITLNNNKYLYSTGFTIDIDNQTIIFNGYTLENDINAGDQLNIIYADEAGNIEEYDESMYSKRWILDFVTAMSKISLGLIRRKFSQFQSIGNTGISLDGDALVSEGTADKQALEETLRLEQTYEGGFITMG